MWPKDYSVVRCLYHNEYSQVYAAKINGESDEESDDSNDEDATTEPGHICVKVVRKRPETKNRLAQREVHVMQMLPGHPNIMKCLATQHGCETTPAEDTTVFFLPLFESSWWTWLTLNKDLPTGYRARYVPKVAQDLFSALAYLHEHSVIHRDVKPDNMMVTKEKGCVLSDFGLALIEGQDEYDASGTLYYAAPEIMRGQQYDNRCDVWSAGVSLVELLDPMETPFPCDTQCVAEIWADPTFQYAPPTKFLAKYVPHWAKRLELCLSINHHKRPRAAALLSELCPDQ